MTKIHKIIKMVETYVLMVKKVSLKFTRAKGR